MYSILILFPLPKSISSHLCSFNKIFWMQSFQITLDNLILTKPGPATSTFSTPGNFAIYSISLLATSIGFNLKYLLKSIDKFVDISPCSEFLGGSNVSFFNISFSSKSILFSDLNLNINLVK